MKSISKKVMAGLGVGAMSLSIWAPTSEAATPEKNGYYSIHLAANSNLVWDVSGNSTDNQKQILLYNGSRGDNEQFAFFPLDEGAYAIVNKNSGKPVSNDAFSFDQILGQTSWNGSAKQQWYLRDQGSNNYEVVNQGNGKVASYASNGVLGPARVEWVDLDESNPSDNDRLFHIPAARSTFSLPTLPAVGTRPNAPDYTQSGAIDQQLPQTSESVVVGASLIPSIMVNDNQASDYTKIHNSPYYALVKEEYWEKVYSDIIPAGGSRKYTLKTGVSSVDQQKMTDTLAMSFGADLGLKFGDSSLSLKSSISKTIQTEVSTTNTDSKEETIEKTAPSKDGKDTGYTEYQLKTKYTLKRTDGSAVSAPWIVKDPTQTLPRTITK